MHDFAVISLSDLMTPWQLIKKRIVLALKGDFVIVLYNPRSNRRKDRFKKAIEIIRDKKGNEFPVGIVKNATREGEKVIVTNIKGVKEEMIDMRTILIIGNSTTRVHGNFIITSRGYDITSVYIK